MGILNSDIGYRIGLLAGGLWAQNYRQRGEEKETAAQRKADLARTLQNWQDLRPQQDLQQTPQQDLRQTFAPLTMSTPYKHTYTQNPFLL